MARRKGKRAATPARPKKARPAAKAGRGAGRGKKARPGDLETGRLGDGETRRQQAKAKPWVASDPLPDGQQERFCQKMATGAFSNYSCYLQAYPNSSVEAARSSSSDLLTKPNIQARIKWIRAEALKDVGESIEKAVRWYQTVIETPVGYVDDESPLAQEVQRDITGNEEDGVVTKVKIKIPCKIKARERIDKLMGFEKPQELNVSLGYEPPGKAMERLTGKGVDLLAILKKAGLA